MLFPGWLLRMKHWKFSTARFKLFQYRIFFLSLFLLFFFVCGIWIDLQICFHHLLLLHLFFSHLIQKKKGKKEWHLALRARTQRQGVGGKINKREKSDTWRWERELKHRIKEKSDTWRWERELSSWNVTSASPLAKRKFGKIKQKNRGSKASIQFNEIRLTEK